MGEKKKKKRRHGSRKNKKEKKLTTPIILRPSLRNSSEIGRLPREVNNKNTYERGMAGDVVVFLVHREKDSRPASIDAISYHLPYLLLTAIISLHTVQNEEKSTFLK